MPQFQINNPTFGSDFELAVVKEGKIVPALAIEGTKKKPSSIGNDCYIQRDGVNAEFNIPPVKNKTDWLKYTDYCFKKGEEILATHGLSLLPLSSHEYEEDQLNQGDLRTLFCTESYDAYTGGKPRKAEGVDQNLRTCGYHFHIGFDRRCPITDKFPSLKDKCALAYYFDLHLGIPSVYFDDDTDRRKMYGQPGDFRFKVIGKPNEKINLFEYRSLGGNLLKSFDLISWVYSAAENVITAFNNREPLPDLNLMYNTICNSDKKTAKALINQHNLLMV
jgi:hypothetical protein